MPNKKNNTTKMKNNHKRKQIALEIMKKRLLIFDKIEEREQKYLKKLNDDKEFDSRLYRFGEEWYNSGLDLNDAPVEYQNSSSFINGFKRGQRLAFIKDIQIVSTKQK